MWAILPKVRNCDIFYCYYKYWCVTPCLSRALDDFLIVCILFLFALVSNKNETKRQTTFIRLSFLFKAISTRIFICSILLQTFSLQNQKERKIASLLYLKTTIFLLFNFSFFLSSFTNFHSLQ